MTTRLDMAKWLVPGLSVVLGVLIAVALAGQHQPPWLIAVSFAIMAAYGAALLVLQRRSDVAQVLAGHPADERWASINDRALALAAQVVALVVVVAFLVTTATGGDAMPYAWVGAVFGLVYLGGIAWYRLRS
jgi:hypothetical protein